MTTKNRRSVDPDASQASVRRRVVELIEEALTPPLHLFACSRPGCVAPTVAVIDGMDLPIYRLCGRHLNAALDGIDRLEWYESQARADMLKAAEFDLLSPIEQWQQDGR